MAEGLHDAFLCIEKSLQSMNDLDTEQNSKNQNRAMTLSLLHLIVNWQVFIINNYNILICVM